MGSLPPEYLVQALLDADVCAELQPEGRRVESRSATASDAGTECWVDVGIAGGRAGEQAEAAPSAPSVAFGGTYGSDHGAGSVSSSPRNATPRSGGASVGRKEFSSGASGVGVVESSIHMPEVEAAVAGTAAASDDKLLPSSRPWEAFGVGRSSWARLERRRLVFPALLSPLEASSKRGHGACSGAGGFAGGSEAFVCGRRVACRSPIFLPGLFHMLQARLANRLVGNEHILRCPVLFFVQRV